MSKKEIAEQIEGMDPLHAYVELAQDMTRRQIMETLNGIAGTNYHVRHLDNWLAGRQRTPSAMQGICRKAVLTHILGTAMAKRLENLIAE